jgi:hypothetical protein
MKPKIDLHNLLRRLDKETFYSKFKELELFIYIVKMLKEKIVIVDISKKSSIVS